MTTRTAALTLGTRCNPSVDSKTRFDGGRQDRQDSGARQTAHVGQGFSTCVDSSGVGAARITTGRVAGSNPARRAWFSFPSPRVAQSGEGRSSIHNMVTSVVGSRFGVSPCEHRVSNPEDGGSNPSPRAISQAGSSVSRASGLTIWSVAGSTPVLPSIICRGSSECPSGPGRASWQHEGRWFDSIPLLHSRGGASC